MSDFTITEEELDILKQKNRCRLRRSQTPLLIPLLGLNPGSLLRLSGDDDEVLVKILSVHKHISTGLVDFHVELVRFCTDEVREYPLTEEVLKD